MKRSIWQNEPGVIGRKNTYFSVLVPFAGYGATKWHPTERTGPFSVLTRGAFSSRKAADAWASANLGGYPYSVKRYSLAPHSEIVTRTSHKASPAMQRAKKRRAKRASRDRSDGVFGSRSGSHIYRLNIQPLEKEPHEHVELYRSSDPLAVSWNGGYIVIAYRYGKELTRFIPTRSMLKKFMNEVPGKITITKEMIERARLIESKYGR